MSQHMVINIIITGDPKSGKSSLKRSLDTFELLFEGDTYSFHGHVIKDNASPLPKADFAVLLLDSSDSYRAFASRQHLNGPTLELPHSKICVIGTKRDLIQADYSNSDLNARGHPTQAAYYSGLPYFTVNCVTGEGLEVFCEHAVRTLLQRSPASVLSKSSRLYSLFGRLADNLLDFIAILFSLPVPRAVNKDTPDLEDLNDELVEELLASPLALEWDRSLKNRVQTFWNSVPTHRISSKLIVKYINHDELTATDYVRRNTRIPIPQFRHRHLRKWMVSDFIPGKMLLECWGQQSMFMKFRIACTLRCYLSQLRRFKGTIPGHLVTHHVAGPLFDGGDYGTFKSLSQFRAWCSMVAMSGWFSSLRYYRCEGQLHKIKPQPDPGNLDTWNLVYAHGDLNFGNILLSDDGVLWIIDWAESGFYPSWFDGVSLVYHDDMPRLFRRFVVGRKPDDIYQNFWGILLSDVHRFGRQLS